MGTTKDIRGQPKRSSARTRPGPANISAKNMGGEVALNGVDASGACQRLTGMT
jgi:hypothetical protein